MRYTAPMDCDVAVSRLDEVTARIGEPARIDAEPPVFTYGWTCGCRVRSDAAARRWSRCGRHGVATNPSGQASKGV